MDHQRALLRHFLAALACRTQKALRGAPPGFPEFRAPLLVRTPHELIRHMDDVLGYARTFFVGGRYRAPLLSDFAAAVAHFHENAGRLSTAPRTGSGVSRHYGRNPVAGSLFRCYDPYRPTGHVTTTRGQPGSA